MNVRVGVKLSQQVFPLAAQRESWQAVDDAGFDHIWLFDHLVAIHTERPEPIYDGWTLLASVAEATKRIHVGLNVTGNPYRHPALLARIAVTVDHVSGGRLEMGIGAGWNAEEFATYGMPFPERPAERIGRLDEACSVLKLLWTEPKASFDGRYYSLREAVAEPKPLQKPYPLLWVGGDGPKRTLRVAARHADVWSCNVWPTVPGAMDRAVALSVVLDEHCLEISRDPRSIRRALIILADGTEAPIASARAAIQAGFTELLLFPARASGAHGELRRGVEDAIALLPRIRSLAA